jgi:hypothetical protein
LFPDFPGRALNNASECLKYTVALFANFIFRKNDGWFARKNGGQGAGSEKSFCGTPDL